MRQAHYGPRPWTIPAFGDFLRSIAEASPSITAGDTLAVATDLEGGIIGVEVIPHRDRGEDPWCSERRDDLNDAYVKLLGELSGPRPPNRVTHVVICREGRAVFGLGDNQWGRSTLYAQNLIDAYFGEVIVVTPHGWTTGRWEAGDTTPNLADLIEVSVATD